MDVVEHIHALAEERPNTGTWPKETLVFYTSYVEAVGKVDEVDAMWIAYANEIAKQVDNPHTFDYYHRKISSEAFDNYAFGIKFVDHLRVREQSEVIGLEQVDRILEQVESRENVILLGNHQAELDPQVLSLLLEETHPKIAQEVIFVAGHRVITDPVAMPFSLGRNLLCIYSKKHTDYPPEEKARKLQHNRRSMKRMAELLEEGGYCIYVAPSGGRDRPGQDGKLEIASFDPSSIEMFNLMAGRSKTSTHFYPLSMCTYPFSPPPPTRAVELGEERHVFRSPLKVAFGGELDMETFPGSHEKNKKLRRKYRADFIHEIVEAHCKRMLDTL